MLAAWLHFFNDILYWFKWILSDIYIHWILIAGKLTIQIWKHFRTSAKCNIRFRKNIEDCENKPNKYNHTVNLNIIISIKLIDKSKWYFFHAAVHRRTSTRLRPMRQSVLHVQRVEHPQAHTQRRAAARVSDLRQNVYGQFEPVLSQNDTFQSR